MIFDMSPAILSIGVIGVLWMIIEAQLYRVKPITLYSKKITKKIKIVFISDLHYGNHYYPTRMKRIVQTINKSQPDLIIVGGDYFDNSRNHALKNTKIDQLFKELSQLKAKQGVITVLGNHDYYLEKQMPSFLQKLENTNIAVLKNQTRALSLDQDTLYIHGIDDMIMGEVDILPLQINKDALNIVVSHNPDFFEKYILNFDIGLSGHTHGGQVNLFGLYAPITESKYGQRYVKTLYMKKKSTIITTKGLGCSMLPIRFFALPEIIELEIMPS